jgi:integrase
MPVEIIKVYKGTNIIKARLSGNRIKYGYRWTYRGKKFTRAMWDLKTDAETELSKLKMKMRNPNRIEYDDEEITLEILLDRWKNKAAKRHLTQKRIDEITKHFKRFVEIAGNKALIQVSEDDLIDYQDARLREKKAKHNHTINKETDMIRTVLRAVSYLFKGLKWEPPKVKHLAQLHDGREVYRSRDELMRILRALKEPVSETDKPEKFRRELCYDAMVIGIEAALRISEVAEMQKSQVHFERGIGFKYGFIVLDSAKTDKQDLIRMSPNVAAILKRRCETNPGKYLFKRENQATNPICQKIRRSLRRACERAGIPYGQMTKNGTVFHTLRHSTITELVVKEKQPLPTVMKFSRHTSIKTIMKYLHPSNEDIEESFELAEIDLSDIENPDEPKHFGVNIAQVNDS